MRVLLLQLDGKMPNLALMRVAAHHRGDEVHLRQCRTVGAAERGLWDSWHKVYASAIFKKTAPVARRVQQVFPGCLVGGTGVDLKLTLEHVGIETKQQDYSIYPAFRQSIGFTQRGCRLNCGFCVVGEKEGQVREENTIAEIWRGEPWPRELILLDNDFFGQPNWRTRIDEIRYGGFKVSFNQGINARMLNDETASAIASVPYYDDGFRYRTIYTAWDNRKDERRLFAGLNSLVRAGVRPTEILVYMLIGYWKGETEEDRDYRRAKIREFGAKPYPMPFVRTPELVGFQRWCQGHYDRKVPWEAWKANGYRPEGL